MKSSYKIISFLFLFSIIFFICACSNHDFKIKGEIYGAENQSLILEKSDFQGRWIPVDSTKINRNGGFSISFPAPLSPEIFRLNLNGQYVYFPIDNKETITLNASAQNFGSEFSLAGSPEAEKLEKFEKELQTTDTSNQDSLINFKRKVYSNYMRDFPGSILNFYILTKTIGNKPLYDPLDPTDRKYFGAVATGFKSQRPDDPHTALLEQTALQIIKNKNKENGLFKEYEASEISLIDIERPDENGKNVRLSDIVGKDKKVVVIFSLLNAEESPQLNIELYKIYNRHKDNVEFYNVSLDADQYAWRDAAKNLPWITVYSPGENVSQDAINYNVYQLPSFFIYDKKGELTDRLLSPEELNKKL